MFGLALLILVSEANSQSAPSFHQNPEVRYLPHGIQVLAPTAPAPGRRRGLSLAARRQTGDLALDLSDTQTSKGYQELFGPDPLGPNPIDQKPQIPEFGGQFKPQPFRLETFGRDPSLFKEQDGESSYLANGHGILDGSPALRLELQRVALGYRLDGPPTPSGHRGDPRGPQIDRWYGLPLPTPLGPYSQRKPKSRAPLKFQTSLSPLQDIGVTKKKETPPPPYDSWRGAQQRDRVPPPPPPPEREQAGPLAPPQMGGKRHPAQEYTAESEEVGEPRHPAEKGYAAPVTRKLFITLKPGFMQHLTESQKSSSRTPPPLLDDHDGFLEELVPESEDVSPFSREQKLPQIADSAPNTFDAILS